MADDKHCPHMHFLATVDVARLEDSGRFMADVRIQCGHCHTDFEFIGLPQGLNLGGATVSIDGLEARLAIKSKGERSPEVPPFGFTIKAKA